MDGGEARHLGLALRRGHEVHAATIAMIGRAPREAEGLQTVHQSHGAVVVDLQVLGQRPDAQRAGVGAHGEQGLVLARGEAGGLGRGFAEAQEAGESVAERRQGRVFLGGHRAPLHGRKSNRDPVLSCYDISA